MAHCKIWSRKGEISQLVNYVSNPDKTHNRNYNDLLKLLDYTSDEIKTTVLDEHFITGINCMPDTCLEEMTNALVQGSQLKPIVNIAYHAEQSFAEGEVTPEISHEIGVKLAEKLWSDYIVLVTTHTNTKHIHNHFVICSYSPYTRKRFNNNGKTKYKMRECSDSLCKEYGLSIIENPQHSKSLYWQEWKAINGEQPTHRSLLKKDIDVAIAHSVSEKEFISIMKQIGYEIETTGKYYTVKYKNYQRAIRLSSKLGEGYSIEDIRKRIALGGRNKPLYVPKNVRTYKYKSTFNQYTKKHHHKKHKGIIALYYRYCYMLGVFDKQNTYYPPPAMRSDYFQKNKVGDELRLLVNNNITNTVELNNHKQSLISQRDTLVKYRNELYVLQKKSDKGNFKELSIEIKKCSNKIRSLNKNIKLCDDIEKRSLERAKILNDEHQTQIRKNKEAEIKHNPASKLLGG